MIPSVPTSRPLPRLPVQRLTRVAAKSIQLHVRNISNNQFTSPIKSPAQCELELQLRMLRAHLEEANAEIKDLKGNQQDHQARITQMEVRSASVVHKMEKDFKEALEDACVKSQDEIMDQLKFKFESPHFASEGETQF